MYQYIEKGSVTSPAGFKAAGIHCGIKRKKKDLALIYSTEPCNAAGVFTTNLVQAAPVIISKKIVDENAPVNALLINSGNANACTGDVGYEDALTIQKYCSDKLNVAASSVLISSTGVIGKRLPVNTILKGIDRITRKTDTSGGIDAAEAIMTTDTRLKSFAVNVNLKNGNVILGGACKGSGMIMPNMATMLAFITTDASIELSFLKSLLTKYVDKSFNKISVDGETSTNDMVLFLSNGASKIKIEADTDNSLIFEEALENLCIKMAKSIVNDGEGATKLITINVTGADTKEDADLVAKSIANSPLVKTAAYGEDANWGRILSAAGKSGAKIDASKTSVYFDNLPILKPNYQIVVDEGKAKKILQKNEFEININLNGGKESSKWWTCDFTEDYIKINSGYRS